MTISFSIFKKDNKSKARTGVVNTPHGSFDTPAFVSVATAATVRSLSSEDLEQLGVQVALANTYHLHLRPGEDVVKKMGGLHKFMNLNKPMFTDSGGFQAFSLGFGMEHNIGKIGSGNIFPSEEFVKPPIQPKWAHVNEQGVEFKSPISGVTIKLTPKKSIQIQEALGADIILAFDECTSPLAGYEYTKKALARTHRWEEESQRVHKRVDQALCGIVQGGEYKDLRQESAKTINDLNFPYHSIGGSLGKNKTDMHNILDWSVPLLNENKPIHLLGIGAVEDIFESVERGIDTFDCVTPTRLARHGYLFLTPSEGGKPENKFRLCIKNKQYKTDASPIDTSCTCPTCKQYTKAYLRHLFIAQEFSYYRLASLHNLHFFLRLMKTIRQAITTNTFSQLKKEWLS